MTERDGRGIGMATWRRLASWMIVSLTLLPVLAGCAHASKPTLLPDAQQVLRVGYMPQGRVPLDPALAAGFSVNTLQPVALLFSGLMALDDHLNPAPWDASSVDISADGVAYTFHLRDGLTFSDGTPITSDDFAYSLNRALDPCVRYQLAGDNGAGSSMPLLYLGMLKDGDTFGNEACVNGKLARVAGPVIQTVIGDSIATPDSRTLTLTLAQPDAAFLSALAHPIASVVEKSLVERYGASWTAHMTQQGGQGASGMYLLSGDDTHDVAGDRLTLSRNPHYLGTKPLLHEVDFLPWGNPSDERAAYLRGESDLVNGPFWNVYAQARGDPDFHEAPMPLLVTLRVDPGSPPLDDVRVRQALSLALDRQKLAAAVATAGYGAQATYHLVPSEEPGYNPDLTGPLGSTSPGGDPAKARALWASYVTDKCHGNAATCAPIRFFEYVSPFGTAKASAMIADMWRAALPGARVGDAQVPGVLVTDNICAYFPIFPIAATGDYPDPRDWLSNTYLPDPTSSGQTSDCQTQSDIVRLLKSAEVEQDQTRRVALYQQAEQQLVSDALLIPLLQREAAWEVKPYVRSYPTPNWLWITPQDWVNIALARH